MHSDTDVNRTINTSIGLLTLTEDEVAILDRLDAGIAHYEEGQTLYASVCARLSRFPTEWEILILRTTVAALPERDDLAARLRALEGATAPESVPETSFETSLGPLILTGQEAATLDMLAAGRASAEDAMALYGWLTARGLPFPPEWEVMVLRLSLAAQPDREDLTTRLATLLETASPSDGLDSTTRDKLAFERAWVRFSLISGLNAGDATERRASRTKAFAAASELLSSTALALQPAQRRSDLIAAIHDTMMSAPSDDLFLLAELGLRRFPDLLSAPDLTEAAACRAYDGLHSLAFAGVSDVRDLSRFDRIVPQFETWLRQKRATPAPVQPMPAQGKPLTIAYLLHTAHFDRGNAVSPLIVSLAEAHGRRADRRILLYATQFIGLDFIGDMAAKGVPMRSFLQETRYDRIDDIARCLAEDGVDVVITEQNRSIAAALFVRRAAPLQIWLDTGFPFWSLKALDWTLSPAVSRSTDRPSRTSPIVWGQASETLGEAAEPAAIAALQAGFPQGSFVLGVFVRLVKLDAAYLAVMKRMLLAYPRFHLVVAGPGDPGAVEAFAQDPELAGRVSFHPGMVDLDVYGSAIDLMCDTFPFIGGNACRQVAARGTPVLARLGTPWDPLLEADRNPDLLARDDDAFIALAIRMAEDADFRDRQRDVALLMAAASADPEPMLADVEAAIAAARAYYADR